MLVLKTKKQKTDFQDVFVALHKSLKDFVLVAMQAVSGDSKNCDCLLTE